MGLFELSRRVAAKKWDDAAKAHADKLERVDSGLPFSAQIGALLEVPRADFALLDGSLLQVPKLAQMPIVAVSRMHLDADDDLALFRLYTDCGTDRGGVGQSYLQVVCRAGAVDDIRDLAYYQFLCRNFPVTEEEQEPFLGKGFGLGQTTYEMADDQLSGIPHVAGNFNDLLAGKDALYFTRDTPAGGDYVAPYRAQENRLDDAEGEKGLTKEVSFMPYVRDLAGGGPNGRQERLLISFEYVETMDGKPAPAVHVDYMAGLALDRLKVKVL